MSMEELNNYMSPRCERIEINGYNIICLSQFEPGGGLDPIGWDDDE